MKREYIKKLDSFDLQRFIKFIEVDYLEGCWLWKGCLRNGYGQFRLIQWVSAHRVSYKYWKGKLLKGLDIDHLCRNRSCVNPNHLEAITRKENIRRGLGNQHKNKSHCINGHEFTSENTYIYSSSGKRKCRKCNSKWQQIYRQQKEK